MAATDGLTFEGTFNNTTSGLFKNNTTGDIGADDARALVTAIKESYLNRVDDSYTGAFPQVTASGTDTYTATLSPPITAYVAGQKFQILFTNANTGAATLNLNAVGALAITKNGATALAAGDIPAGSIKILAYDGTRLQIIGNIGGGGSVASVTGDGVDNTDPANPVLTFPDASDIGLGNVDNVSTVGVQDLFIPASAMWPTITNGCATLAQTEISTSLANIQTLDFDQTTEEHAQFQIVLPRKWNNGTITFVVYWTATAGTPGQTVRWQMNGGAYSNDDPLTGSFGSSNAVDDTLIALNDVHVTSASAPLAIAGTPASADFIMLQVHRGVAGDDLAADAKLLGVSVRITTTAAKDA